MRPYLIPYTASAADRPLALLRRGAGSAYRALIAHAARHIIPDVHPVMRDDDGRETFWTYPPRVAVEFWIDDAPREWVVTALKRFSL